MTTIWSKISEFISILLLREQVNFPDRNSMAHTKYFHDILFLEVIIEAKTEKRKKKLFFMISWPQTLYHGKLALKVIVHNIV